jgi:outer membrane immunogenic protein
MILDGLDHFGEKAAMKQLTCLTIAACASFALALTAFGGPEPLPSGKEMKQVAPAPVPECDFTWTGFYIGANFGYGWGNADTDFEPLPDAATFVFLNPTTLHPDPSGWIGGGQIGFNWQWNKWLVLGVEGDFQVTDIEGSDRNVGFDGFSGVPANPDRFLEAHERMQWFGTVRGRVGIAPWCRMLIYGTGGVAFGNIDYSAQTNFGDNFFHGSSYPTSFSETETGWCAGGGIEYAISHHWTVRAEYLHYDLGSQSRTAPEFIAGVAQGPPFFVHNSFDSDGNIVRGALNFKF